MSKILSITWYKILPPKSGGQKGIALFTKYLSLWHKLVLLCSTNNEQTDEMPFETRAELPVSKSQFLDPFCWRKILATAEEIKPDFILLEHPYHGIAVVKACKKTGAGLIVHSHNIESERFRVFGKWWWKILAYYEKWIHREADLSLFKTENDLQFALKKFDLDKNKCIVIPYGIEKKINDRTAAREIVCKKHGIAEDQKILLFAGTLDYEPNAKAVENIYKKIAPGLDAKNIRMIICGRNKLQKFQWLKELYHPAVIYAGEVEDIATYFTAADIFIDPVETNAGIQTKIIEALGHDCNVVCFDNMTDEQLRSVAGDKIFTAPPGNYELLKEKIYLALDNNGPTPNAFFDTYSWENIIGRLNDKLNAIDGH